MQNERKLAIVTGASTGIGRSIAIALAQRDWNVAFTYLGLESAAASVVVELEQCSAKCLSARSDAGVKVEVERFHDTVAEAFGRPADLLVNNAGIQTWSPLLELEESAWDRVIQTNLKGCFLNTQKFARLLVGAQRPGAIVNIGSGCNKLPFPQLVDYTASKGGIELFTRVSAVELGPHGITVNCVAPGAIEIERTLKEAPEYAASWSKITPLRRIGSPQDVANAVLFFASDSASFVTGQTLWVDGGAFTVPNWAY